MKWNMDFIERRAFIEKKRLPRPLTTSDEDFGTVEEYYQKFRELKLGLIEQQKKLSHLGSLVRKISFLSNFW